MIHRKPQGWLKYMVARRLSEGATAYYWAPPTWAKERGCLIKPESLGTDYGAAKTRCDEVLNPHFAAWRTGNETSLELAAPFGTFDWLVSTYKDSPNYSELPDNTRRSYDGALAMVSGHKLKDGRRFGSLPIASITPGAADKLFEKLKVRPDGSTRTRSAISSRWSLPKSHGPRHAACTRRRFRSTIPLRRCGSNMCPKRRGRRHMTNC
jgi:hypothetical protein